MTATAASIVVMADDAMEQLLGPIRERNRGKLLARLGHVREAVVAGDTEPSEELRADLHALIGALGTYGWPAGSALLRRVQLAVQEGGSAAGLVPELDELIAEVTGS